MDFQSTFSLPSSSNLGHFVLAGVLLLLLTALRRRKHDTGRPWPVVPGALPVIGNSIGALENLYAQLEEWSRLYGQSGVFEFSLFGHRYICICSDEMALRIESQRPYKIRRTRMVNAAIKSIGADGLFAAEGHVWKKDRRLVGPSLNRKNVRDYLASVRLVSGRLMTKLESICDDTVVIGNHILSSTVDIISLVAFDKDVDCVSNGRSEMGEDLKRAFLGSQMRLLSPFPFWKIPIIGQYLDGAGWAIKRLENEFSRLVRENENSPDISEAKTFLAKIISYSKGGSGDDNAMSHKRLTGNLMTMFAAGSETTHVTMCSALHTIAYDKTGLQEELAAEALTMSDLEVAGGLDEITESLPRLRSLIYESLRVAGPTPFIGLENTEPFEVVPGTVLPPQTNFFVPWRYISKLDNADPSRLTPLGPNNTPRADFDARRWLTETPDKGLVVNRPSHKTGFRPFGEGVRVCPGRELAEIEMLVILSSILRKFEIALEPNHAPMKLVTRFTESPNVDIRLILKPRKLSLKEAGSKKKRKAPTDGPPAEGSRKSRRLQGFAADGSMLPPKPSRDEIENEREERVRECREVRLRAARAVAEAGAEKAAKENPTATYEHCLMRVKTMSDKGLQNRVKAIERAAGKHCVVKMAIFKSCLQDEGMWDLAELASEALERLKGIKAPVA